MSQSGLLTEDDWDTEEMTEYVNHLLDRLDMPDYREEREMKKTKVRAIMRFYDVAEQKQREDGDTWSVTPERLKTLTGDNEYGLRVVEVLNGSSTEEGIGTDTIRE